MTTSANVSEAMTLTQPIGPFGESDPCNTTRPAESKFNNNG
jgi:hypothetical protein